MNACRRLLFVMAFVAWVCAQTIHAGPAADAGEAEEATTSIIGQAVMPDEVPEGIDAEGLSMKDAIVLLEGKYSHPRMPYPSNWRAMTPEERREWFEAFEKTEAYEDYTRKVEAARAARPTYTAEIQEDGSYRFDGIKPSWYQLTIRIMHPAAEGKSSYELARAHAMHQFIIKTTDEPTRVGTKVMKLKNVLMPGDTAPNWTAKAYDGSAIKLSDYRGKYVLMDFWATWCSPCKAEVPNLEAVYKKHGGERFEIVGLSLDKTIDLPKAYHKEKPSPYTQGYLGNWNQTETTARAYGVMGIPSIWLIGPDGKIIARDLRGKSLREAVDAALASEATAKNDQ